jgi:hypothetical protein
METFISVLIGIGLSAACGFRVFVPLLMLGVASRLGHLTLAGGFEWMSSDAALIAFAVATVLEVAGYYIPWVDNLLDGIAAPIAVVAGTIVTAALVTEMTPFLKWTLAVIAGGGIAGIVKGTTALTRGTTTMTTGGLVNPLLATAELGSSIVTSLIALLLPALVLLVLIVILGWATNRTLRGRRTLAASHHDVVP